MTEFLIVKMDSAGEKTIDYRTARNKFAFQKEPRFAPFSKTMTHTEFSHNVGSFLSGQRNSCGFGIGERFKP
jgi:hypothetical protein